MWGRHAPPTEAEHLIKAPSGERRPRCSLHQWHSTKLVSYLIAMSREGGPASSESQSDTDSHRGQVRSFP